MSNNADLFHEVGLDPNNPPKTWQKTEDAGYEGIIWSWTTIGNRIKIPDTVEFDVAAAENGSDPMSVVTFGQAELLIPDNCGTRKRRKGFGALDWPLRIHSPRRGNYKGRFERSGGESEDPLK